MAEIELSLDRLRHALARRTKRVQVEVPGHHPSPVPAAVLVPLFQEHGQFHLLFTRRTDQVEFYKGHVSFPGGARDPQDQSLLVTALRESEEEVGLRPQDVTVLGELDDLLTGHNFLVSPFVGLIPYPYPFRPLAQEVAEVFGVPLPFLLEPGNCRVEARPDGRPGYFYDCQGKVIWGVTGLILKQFLDLVSREVSHA